MGENWLYYGDNLDILRAYVKDETIDLVYLDPPFNSNQDYNVLFAEQDGSRSAAQIQAFKDSWRWDQEAANAFMEIVEAGGKVSQAIGATASAEAHGQHLPALRSDGEPLSKNTDGCNFWREKF